MAMARRQSSPSSIVHSHLEKRMLITARFNSIPLMCVTMSAFFTPMEVNEIFEDSIARICVQH